METANQFKRSPLWDKIFSEVKQLKLADCEDDALEHTGLSVMLEELFKKELVSFKKWYDKLTPSEQCSVWSDNGGSHGLFTMSDNALIDKFINIK